MANEVVIQFSTAAPSSWRPFSRGWKNRYSKIIRVLGHSYFSHVDFVVPIATVSEWTGTDYSSVGEYGLLGASNSPGSPVIVGSPRGVAIRTADYQSFGIRRRVSLKTDRADAILAFAREQIGKPFDTGALSPRVFLSDPFYGAVESRDWRHPDKWFCAEMAVCSLEEGGYWGEGAKLPIKKNRITPADLHLMLLMDCHVSNRDTMMYPIQNIKMGDHEI